MLSLIRVAWRLMNPVPPLPSSMSAATRFAAHATHFLLYFLIVAIPLSGWLLVSSSPLGLPTMYFGLFVWPQLPYFSDLPRAAKKILMREFDTVHICLAWSAIVLVTLHVVAALYHHFLRRDVVLARMLPLLRSIEAGRSMKILTAIAAAATLFAAASAFAANWSVDTAKSKLGFTAMWSKEPFTAVFRTWKADIAFDPADLAHAHADVTVQLASEASDEDDSTMA